MSAAREAAAEASAHHLVNCLLREVCGPAHQLGCADEHLVFRLPGLDVVLRVGLRRRSMTGRHRLRGRVERLAAAAWEPLDPTTLAAMIAQEMTHHHPAANPEFLAQVRASEEAIARTLAHSPPAADATGAAPVEPPWAARYLASEQALVFGHPFHPAPKARFVVTGRDGRPDSAEQAGTWRAYAPEAAAQFRLHLLGVPPGGLWEQQAEPAAGVTAALAGLDATATAAGLPAGTTALPVHPWQFAVLTRRGGALRAALRRGEILDLGACGPLVVPTASVRTLYDPAADVFYKTSLPVRITNCVRTLAPAEVLGAVALTRALRPLAGELADRFDGVTLLGEPVGRVAGADGSLGVIMREGLGAHRRPAVVPLLAAAVAAERPARGVGVADLLGSPGALLPWWERYVRLLVPPVLYALGRHGVVLEPHLQNVVLGVDRAGMPAQVLLRDLEGVRLTPRAGALAATLRPSVTDRIGYTSAQGWNRVAYCLLVNNLGEVAAALADLDPALEPRLWQIVRDALGEVAAQPWAPPGVAGLLAGAPLPAKANLRTRWARAADRQAGYVDLPAPWAGAGPAARGIPRREVLR